jgi:hypothetical protein
VKKGKKGKRLSAAALAVIVAFLGVGCAKAPQRDLGEDIVVSEFPTDFQFFSDMTDTAFSKGIMDALSALGEGGAMGFRTAGSPAEAEAAGIVERAMAEAGLANVSREAVNAAAWSFTGAAVTCVDFKGETVRIGLGGYPSDAFFQEAPLSLADAGRGTASDCEAGKLAGKLALIDSNPAEWEAAYPILQVKAGGAAGALVNTVGASDAAALFTQDVEGLSDFPVFAISAADAAALRKELRLSEAEDIPVSLSAWSSVRPPLEAARERASAATAAGAGEDGGAEGGPPARDEGPWAVWGDIPGKTDEVIYVTGNFDGLYHGAFYGASGLAAALGVAKALVGSGYEPLKTIRFLACGADERGGASGGVGGAGLFAFLSENHPEWLSSAFAAVAIEGGHPVGGAAHFGVNVSSVISPFAKHSAGELISTGLYSYDWRGAAAWAGGGPQAAVWDALGIPAVAAGFSGRSASASSAGGEASGAERAAYYHSSLDSKASQGFNEDAFRFNHLLYGKIIIDLDKALVKPMAFDEYFRALGEDYPDAPSAWRELLREASRKSAEIRSRLEDTNAEYLESFETMQGSMEVMAYGLNRELAGMYEALNGALLRLGRDGEPSFAHSATRAHIAALNAADEFLAEGAASAALGELEAAGLAGPVAAFSQEVCEGVKRARGGGEEAEAGPGADRRAPVCDADALARALNARLGRGLGSGVAEGAPAGSEAVSGQEATGDGPVTTAGAAGGAAPSPGAATARTPQAATAGFAVEREMIAVLLSAEQELLRETAAREADALRDAIARMDAISSDYLGDF